MTGHEDDREIDWRLLEETAAGDEAAFRALVERHQDRLLRVCQRLLLDREEAMDAVQEVFLKTWRQAGRLQPKGRLFTWLYRVATNHCLNRLRRRRIVRFLPLGGERSDDGPLPEPEDEAPGPERALASRRRWRRVRRALGELPPSQRVVVVLARFEGLPYRRIGEILGISEGAVESRLFRALRRLERSLP